MLSRSLEPSAFVARPSVLRGRSVGSVVSLDVLGGAVSLTVLWGSVRLKLTGCHRHKGYLVVAGAGGLLEDVLRLAGCNVLV